MIYISIKMFLKEREAKNIKNACSVLGVWLNFCSIQYDCWWPLGGGDAKRTKKETKAKLRVSGRRGKAGTIHQSPRQWAALPSSETLRCWAVPGTWGQWQESNAMAFGRAGPEYSHVTDSTSHWGCMQASLRSLWRFLSWKTEINIMPTSQDTSWRLIKQAG